jgi:chemotaxis protein methyltransferase CheR
MLSNESFKAVTGMFQRVSGIQLGEAKRALVTGRLQKLAQARGLRDVNDYVKTLMQESDQEELVRVVDKLTTNETYFFREPAHYDHLAAWLKQRRATTKLRVWSGASSSGEEAYSLAMMLGETLGLTGWEIVGTDLSTAMVQTAQRAVYPMDRARQMPESYLKRWCRKGSGAFEGQLMVCKELRNNVRFECANLTRELPPVGEFEIIFLRNVLIYFDTQGKADIVRRVLGHLKPDGMLYTGHAESIANMGLPVRSIAPAVYVHA